MEDHIFLKVMPKSGVISIGKQGKLSPRYIGPFEVLERVGIVAYRLALPPSLSSVRDIFHFSMLRNYASCSGLGQDFCLILMRPLRKDHCISWIVETRFCDARL